MHTINSIDVESSINSGQVFLWKKNGIYWEGINGRNVFKINTKGDILSYQKTETDFFRKNDDMKKIIASISKDEITQRAITKYSGLRILKQDPFQCLISFIISSNSNIQKIRLNLEKMSRKFGTKIRFQGQEFFLFPNPSDLANASINEITECGVGYRAKFVKEAAKMVFRKTVDLESLEECNYQDAKESICSIPGVGDKVADCVLLFSLNKLEAFPLDRWMIRILEKYYSDKFHLETKTVTVKQYGNLHEKIVDYFGPYAGYSQQFLFKMERENYDRKWL